MLVALEPVKHAGSHWTAYMYFVFTGSANEVVGRKWSAGFSTQCAWRQVSWANSVNCTATRVAAFKDQKGKLYWYSIQNASVTSLHHKSQCCYQVFLFFTMFFPLDTAHGYIYITISMYSFLAGTLCSPSKQGEKWKGSKKKKNHWKRK